MSTLKEVLCLLAIFVAYGVAGHMDYEDAVLQEEAQRSLQQSASTECWPTTTSPTAKPATKVGHLESVHDTPSDFASGTLSDEISPCLPEIY